MSLSRFYAVFLSIGFVSLFLFFGPVGASADRQGEPAVTPEVMPGVTGRVTGHVTNGTATGSVPSGLTIILHRFDADLNDSPLQTTTDIYGRFVFDNVPLLPDNRYIVTAVYRDNFFPGKLVSPDGSRTTLDLPVTIYELTEDPTVIRITGIQTQVEAINDGLQIVQKTTFTNTSDRSYITSRVLSNNRKVSVIVSLPPGAFGVSFPGSPDRYVVVPEQLVVIDSIPVTPGETHEVQLSYIVPYTDGAIIEQPVYYTMDGAARLWLTPNSVSAASEQLTLAGEETIGSTLYRRYEGTLSLSPGDVLRYELSGRGAIVTGETLPVVTSDNLILVLVAVAAGLMVLLAAIVVFLRRRGAATALNRQTVMDELVRQIARLDQMHDAGQINHDLYHQQRAQLKARLTELMEAESLEKDPNGSETS